MEQVSRALDGRKILLVEDSLDNQEIFRFFLEFAGAHVHIAGTGPEALTSVASFDPDLILMDIQLPELDGKEVTRRLRANGDKRPILALTAHAFSEEREQVMKAGCNGHIAKPVTCEDLIHGITAHLS